MTQVDLWWLKSLKYIWSKLGTVLKFPNLTRLSIHSCESLEYVFTCSMLLVPTMDATNTNREEPRSRLMDDNHPLFLLYANSLTAACLSGKYQCHEERPGTVNTCCQIQWYISWFQASVEKNAREIEEVIEKVYWGSKKRILLLGHSKGGIDAAAALSMWDWL
ncbi:alpha/beta-Hydrolases superfamily protein [Artemisia annua]|uniref:Alpha/beta-Hydrolases superfamily protein n=1 Tax=Artemisia annua TaxID=35608 RepID=A0A2U1Q048_ARTAN|nr:alpha/beta-Hydrolases superfamily protein [Artemisia annua]